MSYRTSALWGRCPKRIDVRPLRALIRPLKAVLGLATGCARLMRPKEAESMHERTDGLERADSRAEFRSERANLRPGRADLRLKRADLRHERTNF